MATRGSNASADRESNDIGILGTDWTRIKFMEWEFWSCCHFWLSEDVRIGHGLHVELWEGWIGHQGSFSGSIVSYCDIKGPH